MTAPSIRRKLQVLELLTEQASLDLSGGGPWHGIDDMNRLRALELCQTIPAEHEKLAFPGRSRQDDRRRYFFSPQRMRHAEADGLVHRRMLQEHAFDLDRTDLLAAAVDLFLEPAHQPHVAVRVDDAKIAGQEPAVDERG